MWTRTYLIAVAAAVTFVGCHDDEPSPDGDADADGDADGDIDGDTDTDVDTDGDTDSVVDSEVDSDADQDDDTEPDGGDADEEVEPSDEYYREATDFADCIRDCGHEAPMPDLDAADFPVRYKGVSGQIDDRDHRIAGRPAADVDLIKVYAEPRTMLEILVEPVVAGSAFNPIVATTDGVLDGLTWNDDASPGTLAARTTIAFPYVLPGVPLYVRFQDGTNYERFWDELGPPYLGGDGFEYVLQINSSPFRPIELGTIAPGDDPIETSGVVAARGDTVYFRVETTSDADVTVTLTRTGPEAFCVVLSTLDTSLGQLIWHTSRCAETGRAVGRFFDLYPPAHFDLGDERVFTVLDWYGDGGPDYTFDLVITAE